MADRPLKRAMVCPLHGETYGTEPGTTARACYRCNLERSRVGMMAHRGTIAPEDAATWRSAFAAARTEARRLDREAARVAEQLAKDLS